MFEQNIYLYWHDDNIPPEIIVNVQKIQRFNPSFNVQICGDYKLNSYKDKYPKLIELFNKISIYAIKSDIARCILLYENGGLWLDCHAVIFENTIRLLYNNFKDFDFCITKFKGYLKTSCLISSKNCLLLNHVLVDMENHLICHYNNEIKSANYIPYNAFKFTGVPVFSNRLNSKGFDFYKTCILNLDGLVKFYACNRNHHHGVNIHKHWSKLQKTRKLFIT